MPNWCENVLTIRGEKEKLLEFTKKYFTDKSIDFNLIVPEPKTPSECPKQYLTDDVDNWFEWYGWRCDNWGTKWNAHNCYLDDISYLNNDDVDDLTIQFDTAWGPPISVINTLIKKEIGLDFTFMYFEGGMWFGGGYDTENGWYEISDNDLKRWAINNCFMCNDEDFE